MGGKTNALQKAKSHETDIGFKCAKRLQEIPGLKHKMHKAVWLSRDILSTFGAWKALKNAKDRASIAESILLDIHLATSGRVFFTTKENFMGLAPAGCLVGDQVCILEGMSVPFVLRKVSGAYKLLGECYVQDAMAGEISHLGGLDRQQLFLV